MATKMYAHPRYIEHDYEVPLPQCMYKTEIINKNIGFDNGPNLAAMSKEEQEDRKGLQSEAVASLLQRQENILSELEKLQQKVQDLSKKAGMSVKSKNIAIEKSQDQRMTSAHPVTLDADLDIVITALPSKPPLSALVLLHLLRQQGIRIMSTSHVHSSLKEPVKENLHQLVKSIEKLDISGNTLTVRFIWKEDLFGPSLIVSPRSQTPIKGDANIARYLCRKVVPDLYESLDETVTSMIDHWTFGAISKILNGTDTDTKQFIEEASKHVAKGNWLAHDSLTLADVVVWSALIMAKKTASLNGDIKRWFENCNEIFSPIHLF